MIKTLLGVRLRAMLAVLMGGGSSAKKQTVAKNVLFAILYIYVAVVFVGFSVLMAIMLGDLLIPLGLSALYLASFDAD